MKKNIKNTAPAGSFVAWLLNQGGDIRSFVNSMDEMDQALAGIIKSGVQQEELLEALAKTARAGSVTAKHFLNSAADGLCLCCLANTTNEPDN